MSPRKPRTVFAAFCVGVLLGLAVFASVRFLMQSQSFGRAVSLADVVTVGLAAFAVIAMAFALGRGWWRSAVLKSPDAGSVQRDGRLDILTRQGFELALDKAVRGAAGTGRPLGLVLVDLRGFRTVNAAFGYAVGDEILKAIVARLRNFSKELSRIGGDEFALIVEADSGVQSIRHLGERIRQALAMPCTIGGSDISVGVSLGAAVYPAHAEDAVALLRAADAALSEAKQDERSAFVVCDAEIGKRARRTIDLERDLRHAVRRGELVLFYQPQLELASGKVRGYEALLRWERPGQGLLSPKDFLDVAEKTGLIGAIGEWVLRKACADAADWLDAGTVAVNLCASQFRLAEMDQVVAKVLAETGLPAGRLEIEVPESLFLKPSPEVMETLNRIKGLGVRVAMDDFGASYSSLASIAHFPFDKIKIDKSFVGQLAEDADVAAIVASIVGLGRSLSVDVTAEGVETNDQVTLLRAAGCSVVQGFLFGMPKREARLAVSGDAASPGGMVPANSAQG